MAPSTASSPSVLFGDRLAAAVDQVGAPVAVGLDPHLDRLPGELGRRARSGDRAAAGRAVERFCLAALDALEGTVAAVKPQSAFFEQLGAPGIAALEAACQGARDRGLLVILDAKRGDISSTAAAYARAALDPEGPMAADALTVSPWLGFDTLQPYLPACREHGRGLFVLVRTTNPGSAALQQVGSPTGAHRVADEVARLNADGLTGDSGLGSIGAVVGAQVAAEAQVLRGRMPAAWFLVPGLGSQGGAPADALAGRRPDGLGSLPVASRSVLFGEARPGESVADGIHRRARALVESVRAVG
jgi:orotidine-5'-phosphate decarboxylase